MQLLNFDESKEAKLQLARDEAMLQWADGIVHENELTDVDTETFRLWQFASPTVVLGRSSKIDDEVNRDWCETRGIEVLRRCTGGASVVGGPGCWMYSVVLRLLDETSIRKIDVAHDYVMTRVLSAVQRQVPHAERQGICDLTLDERKFSGNSLRVARNHLLYHGTLLIDADLDLIADCLDFAPRQPDYRRSRDHRDFVTNLPAGISQLTRDLAERFGATPPNSPASHAQIESISQDLMRERYNNSEWHTRR